MALEMIKKINVDFYDNNLIYINAKQNDKLRYILITFHNEGEIVRLDQNENHVFIRGKKPDDNGIFNSCEITEDGEVKVALTEQAMRVSGIMAADIVVHNSDGSVVSTMPFCINIVPTALDNSEIESSYEFDALNDLMVAALDEYNRVITECKEYHDSILDSANISRSYAVGDTGTREGEEVDNAKYYLESAKQLLGTMEMATVEEVKDFLGIE